MVILKVELHAVYKKNISFSLLCKLYNKLQKIKIKKKTRLNINIILKKIKKIIINNKFKNKLKIRSLYLKKLKKKNWFSYYTEMSEIKQKNKKNIKKLKKKLYILSTKYLTKQKQNKNNLLTKQNSNIFYYRVLFLYNIYNKFNKKYYYFNNKLKKLKKKNKFSKRLKFNIYL